MSLRGDSLGPENTLDQRVDRPAPITPMLQPAQKAHEIRVEGIKILVKESLRQICDRAINVVHRERGEPRPIDSARFERRVIAPPLSECFDHCVICLLGRPLRSSII